jgi:hypothetical protein
VGPPKISIDSTIICVEPWVMMVRLMVRGDGVVDHLSACAHLAEAPEGLADAVEDHHRLVDRIAQHRQHRRQHRQRELPLEEGEEAQDDDHVVQVGDDAGDRELPLEANGQVGHDAEDHEGQRQRAVFAPALRPPAGRRTRCAQLHGSGRSAAVHAGRLTASPCGVVYCLVDVPSAAQFPKVCRPRPAHVAAHRQRISTSREVPKFCTCTSA